MAPAFVFPAIVPALRRRKSRIAVRVAAGRSVSFATVRATLPAMSSAVLTKMPAIVIALFAPFVAFTAPLINARILVAAFLSVRALLFEGLLMFVGVRIPAMR